MTSQLRPLPECELASISLRKLRVDVDTPIGWAPACLALATTIEAVRPGVRLRLRVSEDSIRVHADGGTVIGGDPALEPQMAAWLITSPTTAHTCGNCGRPGLRRLGSPLAICDACRYLAIHTESTELPFTPPLPLPDQTLAAIDILNTLERPDRFAQIPTGWSRLVLSTVRDMPSPELAATVRFTINDDVVSLTFGDEVSAAELLALNERLEVNARVHCRRCSRRLTTEPGDPSHDPVCPGCRWVQSRGWAIVTGVVPFSSPGIGTSPDGQGTPEELQ